MYVNDIDAKHITTLLCSATAADVDTTGKLRPMKPVQGLLSKPSIEFPIIKYRSRDEIKGAKKIILHTLKSNHDVDLTDKAKLHALSLLYRSVELKHERLAIQRFLTAVKINAPINEVSMHYCQSLIEKCR